MISSFTSWLSKSHSQWKHNSDFPVPMDSRINPAQSTQPSLIRIQCRITVLYQSVNNPSNPNCLIGSTVIFNVFFSRINDFFCHWHPVFFTNVMPQVNGLSLLPVSMYPIFEISHPSPKLLVRKSSFNSLNTLEIGQYCSLKTDNLISSKPSISRDSPELIT